MLDLVPLARARRKMTHLHAQAGLIHKLLQFEFPESQPPSIAAAGIRRNEDGPGLRIEPSPFMPPPSADRGDSKFARVVTRADIDETAVAPDVINAKGIGARHRRRRKIVHLHLLGILGRPPLPARIREIPDQLFTLR